MRHHVDRLEVSALVDGAGGGGETHPRHGGEAHHLRGDLVPVQHVHVQPGQDDGVVPVQGVAVAGQVLRRLPLQSWRRVVCQVPVVSKYLISHHISPYRSWPGTCQCCRISQGLADPFEEFQVVLSEIEFRHLNFHRCKVIAPEISLIVLAISR